MLHALANLLRDHGHVAVVGAVAATDAQFATGARAALRAPMHLRVELLLVQGGRLARRLVLAQYVDDLLDRAILGLFVGHAVLAAPRDAPHRELVARLDAPAGPACYLASWVCLLSALRT